MANPNMLLSDVAYVRLSLAENSGDRVKVRGEFAKCGVATENKRVYPKQVWEKEIKRLNKALKERRVFGEIDHPSDGQTKLTRVSHIVTELRIEDGIVVGEAEILPTKLGQDLLALMQANVPVGVSSRGFGSVKTNESGQDVVQDDYKLVTFDFVADPADVDAYPSVQESKGLFEGVQFELDDEQTKALEFARRIEAEKTGVAAEAETDLREAFTREILSNLATMKAEVRTQLKQEMMTDPAIAGAKAALDKVRDVLTPYILPEDVATVVQTLHNEAADRELRIKELESENTALAEMAKEVGYRYFLERELSSDPQADAIRRLVGDVKTYANSDALKARMEAIRAELQQQDAERVAAESEKNKAVNEAKQQEKAAKAEFDARLAKIERLIAAEREQREELEHALEQTQQENESLKTKLYTEQRLAAHPKAAKLRNIVESTNVTDTDSVDALIEQEREPVRDEEDLQEVRARIRSRMRASEPQELRENTEARRMNSNTKRDYQGLGIDLDNLRRLSGISNR